MTWATPVSDASHAPGRLSRATTFVQADGGGKTTVPKSVGAILRLRSDLETKGQTIKKTSNTTT